MLTDGQQGLADNDESEDTVHAMTLPQPSRAPWARWVGPAAQLALAIGLLAVLSGTGFDCDAIGSAMQKASVDAFRGWAVPASAAVLVLTAFSLSASRSGPSVSKDPASVIAVLLLGLAVAALLTEGRVLELLMLGAFLLIAVGAGGGGSGAIVVLIVVAFGIAIALLLRSRRRAYRVALTLTAVLVLPCIGVLATLHLTPPCFN